jgi:predicted nucleic acid-binding protein
MRVLPVATTSATALEIAFVAFEAGRFGLWDALLLAAAGEAGCKVVLSEDMQDGAELAGVVVRNPLRGDRLPEDLAALLGLA